MNSNLLTFIDVTEKKGEDYAAELILLSRSNCTTKPKKYENIGTRLWIVKRYRLSRMIPVQTCHSREISRGALFLRIK